MGSIQQFRKKYPKVCEIPFNSSNKYQVRIQRNFKGFTAIVSKVATSLLLLYSLHYLQLSIHEQPDSDSHLLVMKGYSYNIILVLFS